MHFPVRIPDFLNPVRGIYSKFSYESEQKLSVNSMAQRRRPNFKGYDPAPGWSLAFGIYGRNRILVRGHYYVRAEDIPTK